MALFKMQERDNSRDAIKEKLKKTKSSSKQRVTVTGNTNTKTLTASIEALKQLYAGVPMAGLRTIYEVQELDRYVDACIEFGEYGIDTESFVLEKNPNPIIDEMTGFSLYVPGQDSVYIPISHVNYMTGMPNKKQMTLDDMKGPLKKLADSNAVGFIHNAKYDIRVFRWLWGYKEVDFKKYWCCLHGSNFLNENEPHGLKALYAKYIDPESDKNMTFGKLFKGIDIRFIPIEVITKYAGKDAKMHYELGKFQQKFLGEDAPKAISQGLVEAGKTFREIENPLLYYIADMEDNGVRIDLEYASGLSVKYHGMLDALNIKINKELEKIKRRRQFKDLLPTLKAKLDDPINIGSTDQLAILLYDVLELKAPHGGRGTGVDVLEYFVKDRDLAFCKLVLEYRGVVKLLSTYIDKFPKIVRSRTGHLHGQFNPYGAVTGRFSSSDPNLQNIPSHNKEIRKMFAADDYSYLLAEGYDKPLNEREVLMRAYLIENKLSGKFTFIGGDYSQQEPRTLAFLSKDKDFIKAYEEGKDLYATVASVVFGCDYDECLEFSASGELQPEGKERRNFMKSVVLGLMYGRGASSIAEQIGKEKEFAQKIIDDFYDAFPSVTRYINNLQDFARDNGFVYMIDGRKRRLPDIQLPKYGFPEEMPDKERKKYTGTLDRAWGPKKKQVIEHAFNDMGWKIKDNGGFIAQAERQCLNSVIQGSSASMTKKAMLMIFENGDLIRLNCIPCLQIHDEIMAQCPIEYAEEAAVIFRDVMLEAAADYINLPMSIDVEITDRWYGSNIDFSDVA